jgi:transaldolase
MKIFLDTAELNQIEALLPTGMIDGVTTNPSLIAKSGGDIKKTIAAICELVDGPVSAEVTATDIEGMLAEADVLSAIAPQVTIKVPLTKEGLIVCRQLSERGIMVNVTLCFSAAQALLAAKAGARFISPFVGRLDDLAADGMNLIADICTIYDHYDFNTEILVASARHPQHVVDAALLGADVITLPPAIIDQLYKHPLTDKGLAAFLDDWKKTGQSIV